MRELIVSRHQLHWVTRQLGLNRWPFPFRAPTWNHSTADDMLVHRRRVEQELLGRGLISRGRDGDVTVMPLLRDTTHAMARWSVLVDMVYLGNPITVAACYRAGNTAVRICGDNAEGEGALRILPIDPEQLARAALGAAPRVRDGSLPVTRIPARDDILTGGVPREHAAALGVVRPILDAVTAKGHVAVASRPTPGAEPVRGDEVTFFESRGRRYLVMHVEDHGAWWAEFHPGSAVLDRARRLVSSAMSPATATR